MTKPRIALVIGSGGIKCAAAVGLWKVLQEEGIHVDMLVGCSGGSVYAAAIAMGWSATTLEQKTISLWDDGVLGKVHLKSVFSALLPKIFGFSERFGLVDDGNVGKSLLSIFGSTQFDRLSTPLHLVTTDLHTGARVVLSSGVLRHAVRASMAVPIIFRPIEIDGKILFDGGVSDPLPVSVAIKEGSDIIIAMGFENTNVSNLTSITGLISQTLGIVVNNLLRSSYAFYNVAHHAEVVPVLPEFGAKIELSDVDQIPYLIKCGEVAAREQIPYIRRLIESLSQEPA